MVIDNLAIDRGTFTQILRPKAVVTLFANGVAICGCTDVPPMDAGGFGESC